MQRLSSAGGIWCIWCLRQRSLGEGMEQRETDREPQLGEKQGSSESSFDVGMKGAAPLGQGCLSVCPSRTEGPCVLWVQRGAVCGQDLILCDMIAAPGPGSGPRRTDSRAACRRWGAAAAG